MLPIFVYLKAFRNVFVVVHCESAFIAAAAQRDRAQPPLAEASFAAEFNVEVM